MNIRETIEKQNEVIDSLITSLQKLQKIQKEMFEEMENEEVKDDD